MDVYIASTKIRPENIRKCGFFCSFFGRIAVLSAKTTQGPENLREKKISPLWLNFHPNCWEEGEGRGRGKTKQQGENDGLDRQ